MRRKPFLAYFILCAIPLLMFAGLNYWNGIRSVDSTTRTIVQEDLNAFNSSVDELLNENERALLQIGMSRGAQSLFLRKDNQTGPPSVETETPQSILNSLPLLSSSFQSVTLFNSEGYPRWTRTADFGWALCFKGCTAVVPDRQVWTLRGNVAVEKLNDSATAVEYSVPIQDEKGASTIGAVVGVLDLESVFYQATRGLPTRSNQGALVIALDQNGKILYHRDRSLKLRSINQALPELNSISTALTANQSGVDQFRSPAGSSYMAAYAPIPRLKIGVAVARSRSEFLAAAHRWGVVGLVLALLVALGAAFVLERHVQSRSKGIARVTEDVSAIAKGELDRRIILQSSDDARGLADNINVMTERLRAQIAREEESRQFESFIRLSAMLTHDLKNAIEGLSLTVGNMERHFDNPQFRADALKGLTSATDKLKALVARLSRPVSTLSGEHKRPANIDLIPIIQRVIAMTAEPQRSKHTIVTRLPQNLYALADPMRIEEVLDNLVLNALEAMPDKGGTLTIEAAQTANGAATFSISDTGHGMSRHFIDTRLFRPFSTTKKTGIGLGLYTCREVIQASGGSIEAESVEGAGTTFRIVLPSSPHDRRN